jgi:hypothetical protein
MEGSVEHRDGMTVITPAEEFPEAEAVTTPAPARSPREIMEAAYAAYRRPAVVRRPVEYGRDIHSCTYGGLKKKAIPLVGNHIDPAHDWLKYRECISGCDRYLVVDIIRHNKVVR